MASSGGIPAARLGIEIYCEIARLQSDLDRAKRLVGAMSADVARSMKSTNDNFASAGAATAKYSGDVARLKGQLDPAWQAQVRYNDQVRLGMNAMKSGAIDRQQFGEHMRSISSGAMLASAANDNLGRVTKLSGHHALNAAFQFQDLGVQMMMAAGSAHPLKMGLTALVQQGTQLYGIMQQSGLGVKGFTASLLASVGILKVTSDAQAAAAAAGAVASQAAAVAQVELTVARLAATEAAVAESAATLAGAKNDAVAIAATQGLAFAKFEQAVASGAATKASEALSVANAEVAATARLAAASQGLAFAPMALIIGAVTLALAGLGLAFKGLQSDINENSKVHVSWKNTLLGTYDLIAAKLKGVVAAAFDYLGIKVPDVFKAIQNAAKTAANFMINALVAVPKIILDSWRSFPAAIADVFYATVNGAIRAINGLLSKASEAQNVLADKANAILAKLPGGLQIPKLQAGQISELSNSYAGAGAKLGRVMAGSLRENFNRDNFGMLADAIKPYAEARQLAEDAAKAGKGKAGSAGKQAGGDAGKAFKDEFAGWAEAAMAEANAALIKMGDDFAAAAALRASGADAEFFTISHGGTPEELKLAADAADDLEKKVLASQAALKDLAQIAGEIDLDSVFGKAGTAMDRMVDTMARLADAQDSYATAIARAGGDQAAMAKADATYGKAKLNGTLAMLSATKSLFKEQSVGYQVIGALEKAAMAQTLVKTAIDVAAGAAKMFSFLGPFAFPAVAAMMAVMAGLGFKGGAGSGTAPPTAKDLQESTGTGSVLGDSSEKSDSIGKSLAIVAANTNRDLEYSNQMLTALRSIDQSIGAMAGTVARQISVSGSMFDTGSLKLGSSGSSGFLGLFASSTTRELYDAGIKLAGSTVADITANGITGQTYQIVQQVKKKSGFLGIGGGTKTTYETTNGAVDPGITSAIQDVIANLRNGLVQASKVVGLEGAEALLNGFRVEIGTLSFKGMTGEEIEKQLNAVFSKVGDDLAGALLPGLADMQQIGEGLFETFIRVAREYQVVDVALRSVGLSFGAVGLESLAARDNLVQLLGGLDKFVEATNFYRDTFLTGAERLAPIAASVASEMERLGLASVATKDQFKAVVAGIDLTSSAGQELYAALMAVAPGFAKVADAATDAATKAAEGAEKAAKAALDLEKRRTAMQIQILENLGRSADAKLLKDKATLDATEDGLKGLQLTLFWSEKVAAQRQVTVAAYQRESAVLGATAERFRGFAKSLTEFRDGLSASGSPDGQPGYVQALTAYMKVAGGAQRGNESDLGSFAGVSKTFLSAAYANAGSEVEYRRALALVRNDAGRAIAASNGAASGAEQQLAAMTAMVSQLTTISEAQPSLAEAMRALEALNMEAETAQAERDVLHNPVPMLEAISSSSDDIKAELAALRAELSANRAEMAGMRGDIKSELEKQTGYASRTSNSLENVTRGRALVTVPE